MKRPRHLRQDDVQYQKPESEFVMRVFTLICACLSLTACSMLPESWNLDQKYLVNDETVATPPVITDVDLSAVEVGQTKAQVLSILGPAAQVDDGMSLAEHYVKGGEIYDVLYFRGTHNGAEDIRALLFKADVLVGIGWSSIE
jgi:hypothetical protein